jgi:arylsulfatase A-like enzyme
MSSEDGSMAGPPLRQIARRIVSRIPGPTPPPPGPAGGPLSLLALSAWFGLVTGLIELIVLVARYRVEGPPVFGKLQMSRHFPWTVPVGLLAIFLACGLPLAPLAAWRPAPSRRVATFVLCGLSSFALLANIAGLNPAAAAALAAGLACVLSRSVERRADRVRRAVRASLPALLGVVAILGAWSYNREVLGERRALAALPPAAPGAPNVLLIVLDTVRADHLGLYGYGRDTSPNLSRLAKRGVVFEQARSAAPWTLPSHATMFTGRWPHELGTASDRPLDASYPTLAEFLARHGYATAGFVGNGYYGNSWYGLARGFGHYEDSCETNVLASPAEALRSSALGRRLIRMAGVPYKVRPDTAYSLKDAERVNRDFLGWLSDHPGRPVFAFLNYIDAHDPYLTPPGFDRHFGLAPETADDVELIRNWHSRDAAQATDRQLALIRDAYDDCLASLDEHLGRLFDELERRGVLDDTLVIVTADHGEQLGEHNLFGHGKSLYRQEVRVPLILVGPLGIPPGRTVAGAVSLRDIPATVVDRLGLSGGSPFPGRSLARFWDPSARGAEAPDEPILSEVSIKPKAARPPSPGEPPALGGPMASLIADGRVYIRDAFGREELYDLADDPCEAHDLSGSAAARPALERCRIALDRLVPDDAPPKEPATPALDLGGG